MTMRPLTSIIAPRVHGSTVLAIRSSTSPVRSGNRIATIRVAAATKGPITRANARVRWVASWLGWECREPFY